MNTRKIIGYGLLTVIIALAFTACKESDPPKNESTITAFGKTIKVRGDASISTADFNTAKGKLGEAMVALDEGIYDQVTRGQFAVMLGRVGFAILIKTGNASPDAGANKSMTIGVNYLLNNDAEPIIANAIVGKVVGNAFAD